MMLVMNINANNVTLITIDYINNCKKIMKNVVSNCLVC